ncbi:MAG: M42 family metallopeptidase [Anaerolineaceae bacterium]|nr:M42 family metallopeptidase [Anaerolineaceae bacterium]
MKELLDKLTNAFGPSGYESQVRDLILETIKDDVDEYRIDALGNLIARKGTRKENGKRIMVSAHMDEIGLMVTHVDEQGFAYVTNLGGVRPLNCVSNRIVFANGTEGMLCARDLEDGKIPAMNQFFVDTGASSREDCKVEIGDPAVFVGRFVDMGDRWMSKTMDDRIGCLIAIEALKALKDSPNEVWFVFSVQEEVGLRGAKTAAYGVDPEIGIALDVTMCFDTPGLVEHNLKFGAGPCIKAKDGSLIGTPWLNNALYDAAERAGIPYQVEVLRSAGTDAGAITLTRAGVPSSAISIACRYVHTPSEMVDVNDVKQAIKLLTVFLEGEIEKK